LSVWKRNTEEAGRDASLKYKYDPKIPVNTTENATAEAKPVKEEVKTAAIAEAATPPASLV